MQQATAELERAELDAAAHRRRVTDPGLFWDEPSRSRGAGIAAFLLVLALISIALLVIT